MTPENLYLDPINFPEVHKNYCLHRKTDCRFGITAKKIFRLSSETSCSQNFNKYVSLCKSIRERFKICFKAEQVLQYFLLILTLLWTSFWCTVLKQHFWEKKMQIFFTLQKYIFDVLEIYYLLILIILKDVNKFKPILSLRGVS